MAATAYGDEHIGGLGSGPRYPLEDGCDCCKRPTDEVVDLADGICGECYQRCGLRCEVVKR